MKMKPVISTVLKSVGYDSSIQVLRIEFVSGDVHDYQAVQWWVVGQLLSSSSLGDFYHENIRESYVFRISSIEENAV